MIKMAQGTVAPKFCELLEAMFDDELKAPKEYTTLRFSVPTSIAEDERSLLQHLFYTIAKDEEKHQETLRYLRSTYCGKP